MRNRLSGIHELISERVRLRPDSEFQQAVIRLSIVLAISSYFMLDWFSHPEELADGAAVTLATFTLASVTLIALAIIDNRASVIRRSIGMLFDHSANSYMLIAAGATGVPLVSVYLWVTVGNGFRFGISYLVVSTIASAVGFAVVGSMSPFWSSQPYLWWGMLIMMVAVPLYAALLLRKLQHSIEREKQASAAKSNFIASMSHELRTPLSGVIGAADLLSETKLDSKQRELVRVAHSSATVLLGLIDDVLDISRIEAGKFTSVAEDFDLHVLANSVVSALRGQAEKKGLLLNLNLSPEVPFRLHGDSRHLRQILVNLVGNAIKFTEHGWVALNIRLESQDDRTRILFEIADTGIGIAPENQGRIFDTFTQADTSTTRRFGGTGLGTTIVKRLVELLGGEIGVRSQLGEGSTFWLVLPFAPQRSRAIYTDELFDSPVRVAVLARESLSEAMSTMIVRRGGEAIVVQEAADLTESFILSRQISTIAAERSQLHHGAAAFIRAIRESTLAGSVPVILVGADGDDPMRDDASMIRDGYASVLHEPVSDKPLFNAIHAANSHAKLDTAPTLSDLYRLKTGGNTPLRVLVAEDNPVNQRVIRGLLEHIGHDVVVAKDGEEALDKLGEEDFDLAIIDMHMPHLSGPEVVKRWRAIAVESRPIPFIMLTADARTDAQSECQDAGANAFLTKPVSGVDLVDTLARFATHNRSTVAQTSSETTHSTDANGAIDEGVLTQMASFGGYDMVIEVLASFAVDSARCLRDARRALDMQDRFMWYDQLHMMKGSALDIGASKLADLCLQAERMRQADAYGIESFKKLEEIEAALVEVTSAIRSFTAKAAGTRPAVPPLTLVPCVA